MARKRTPTPEMQTSDRSMVAGCAQILAPIAERYPAHLLAAVALLRNFAASKVEVPAKRKAASTKAKPAFTMLTPEEESGMEEHRARRAMLQQ